MTIADNLARIHHRIAQACRRAGRDPEEVTLVCVSKTVPATTIQEAYKAGARVFGENYGQHLRDKAQELSQLPDLCWHFIGALQKNKVKYAVGQARLLHSVDSPELIQEVDKRAAALACVQEVLIQVNLSGEVTKSGVPADRLPALLEVFGDCSHCRCVGLMTLPPFFDDPQRARPLFAQLRALAEKYRGQGVVGVEFQHLSMGMSGDFEVAVEEGATLVRVGTAIFGARV